MATRLFKEGDVIQRGENTWDCRIIFAISEDHYYFCDYNCDTGTFFYNPTKSAYKFPDMEAKFHKVGVINDLKAFQEDMALVMKEFEKAFAFAHNQFTNNKITML